MNTFLEKLHKENSIFLHKLLVVIPLFSIVLVTAFFNKINSIVAMWFFVYAVIYSFIAIATLMFSFFVAEKAINLLYCEQNKIDAFKKEYDELKKEYYDTRAYFDNTHDNFNNVWHFSRTRGDEKAEAGGHATPKPIELCARSIKSSCPKNEIVLDFFLVSGSTLIACEQTDRICYGVEIEPKYIDVIIARW